MKIVHIIILMLLMSSAINADKTKLLTEQWSPYQMEVGGSQKGIVLEIVQELQKIVGNSEKIKFYPWNRGYNLTLKKSGFALFSTSRTTQREKDFKWVGPFMEMEYIFFKLKSNKKVYKSIEDAKNAHNIYVTKSDALEQMLKKQGFKNLVVKTYGSNEGNLKKLMKSKSELWASSKTSGLYRINELNFQDKVTPTQIPAYATKKLYMSFNKNTSDETVKLWQDALNTLKSNGVYDKIVKKYNY